MEYMAAASGILAIVVCLGWIIWTILDAIRFVFFEEHEDWEE